VIQVGHAVAAPVDDIADLADCEGAAR